MKYFKMQKNIWIFALLLCSLIGINNESSVFAATTAYNCQTQYNAWKRDSNAGTIAAVKTCIFENPAYNRCKQSAFRAENTDKGQSDCIAAYIAGFFGHENKWNNAKNVDTYNDAKTSAGLYLTRYNEQRSGGTDSTAGGGGATDPATQTGPAGPTATTTPPGGAGTGEETPTQSFGGDVNSVSKDLNTSTINLTADDLKKAGIVVADTNGTKLVAQTLNAVYSLAATVAVIVIIAAGFIIITADGDAQKLATGRKAIIYACVGLIIIASAFIITGIIQTIGSK